MVSYREGTRKDGTGLAVLSLTVAEEERIAGRVVVSQPASLPYETTGQHRTVIHMRTGRDNEIISEVYRGG